MQNLDEPYFAPHMLNERRQSQKATHCTVSHIGNDGLGKSTDTDSRTGFPGAVGRENGEGVLIVSFVVMKRFQIKKW